MRATCGSPGTTSIAAGHAPDSTRRPGAPIGSAAVAPTRTSSPTRAAASRSVCNPVGAGCRLVYRSDDRSTSSAGRPARPRRPRSRRSGPTAGSAAACRVQGRWQALGRLGGLPGRRPVVQVTLGDVRGAGASASRSRSKSSTRPTTCVSSRSATSLLMVGNFVFGNGDNGRRSGRTSSASRAPWSTTAGPRTWRWSRAPKRAAFRIQVQFRAPEPCGSTCKARGEIRNRTGVCSAACLASGGEESCPATGRS